MPQGCDRREHSPNGCVPQAGVLTPQIGRGNRNEAPSSFSGLGGGTSRPLFHLRFRNRLGIFACGRFATNGIPASL